MGNRIGLVGYSSPTGLGELNRQIATYIPIDSWAVIEHGRHGVVRENLSLASKSFVVPRNRVATANRIINEVDTLLFCETDYVPGLAQRAKTAGKRVVCVPMLEWTPNAGQGFTPYVDLFICPTRVCYERLSEEGLPCVYFSWPTDTIKFSPIEFQTDVVNSFLYVHGTGGWNDRKGLSIVMKALEIEPDLPLRVVSQSPNNPLKSLVKVDSSHVVSTSMYRHPLGRSEVLIAPHHVDGLGLQQIEAMCCGIPVITPDASPWDELPAIRRLPVSSKNSIKIKRTMDWVNVSPIELVDTCLDLLGEDIQQARNEALNWASSMSWSSELIQSQFYNLVTGNQPLPVLVGTGT